MAQSNTKKYETWHGVIIGMNVTILLAGEVMLFLFMPPSMRVVTLVILAAASAGVLGLMGWMMRAMARERKALIHYGQELYMNLTTFIIVGVDTLLRFVNEMSDFVTQGDIVNEDDRFMREESERQIAQINENMAMFNRIFNEKQKELMTKGRDPLLFLSTMHEHMPELVKLGEGMRDVFPSLLPPLKGIINRYQQRNRDYHEILYRLEESVTLLGTLSDESNSYSRKSMDGILLSFKDLTVQSQKISKDISTTMMDVMDVSQRHSLSAITHETEVISRELDSFFRELGELKKIFQNLLDESAVQFEKIKVMAKGIEEFSESIRIISLNVNIEAARAQTGERGAGLDRGAIRGFHVLSKNMGDFAVKAQGMAIAEKDTINLAIASLRKVDEEFVEKLEHLLRRIPEIRRRLDPFEGIIGNSFTYLEGVIKEMSGLSETVERRLVDIIGKLQFQDLTRQESEHLIEFLKNDVNVVAYVDDDGETARAGLSEDEKEGIRKEMLEHYSEMATTSNEHTALSAVARKYGLETLDALERKAEGSRESMAGSVELFGD